LGAPGRTEGPSRGEEPAAEGAGSEPAGRWGVRRRRGVLEMGFGTAGHQPQLAALHLNSGYLRLTYAPGGTWGTSVVLLPSFWAEGRYHQGAPLEVTWRELGPRLALSFSARPGRARGRRAGGLEVRGEVRIAPPQAGRTAAAVALVAAGAVGLDDRPDAFKPVLLSSMHTARDRWDARRALLDGAPVAIPDSGPFGAARARVRRLALVGGTSSWKRDAPTVEVELHRALAAGGWVTPSTNPDDDNVALWAASDGRLDAWHYEISATGAPAD
jgi:hypothetical protein